MIVQFVLQSKYSPFLISPTNSGVIIIIIVVFVFWLFAPIQSLVYLYTFYVYCRSPHQAIILSIKDQRSRNKRLVWSPLSITTFQVEITLRSDDSLGPSCATSFVTCSVVDHRFVFYSSRSRECDLRLPVT